jgi:hypothetical protein
MDTKLRSTVAPVDARSPCAAMPAATPRRSGRCWRPDCARCRWRPPRWPPPRPRSAGSILAGAPTVWPGRDDERTNDRGCRARSGGGIQGHSKAGAGQSAVRNATAPGQGAWQEPLLHLADCQSRLSLPISVQHLETMFELCHFSQDDRRDFLAGYRRAHPRRFALVHAAPRTRIVSLAVPDLGDAKRNRAVDAMITDFVRRLRKFVDDIE